MKKILLLFLLQVSIGKLYARQQAVFGGVNQQLKDTVLQQKVTGWIQNNEGLKFIENKGQMADMQGKADKDLLFKACAGGVDMYITTSGISYVFIRPEHVARKTPLHSPVQPLHGAALNDSIIEHYGRADMELVGADIRPENIIKEYESHDRADYYYGGICSNGIVNVHSYQQITIKNIYPGIDWILYTATAAKAIGRTERLQYDFVVHPGGNPAIIKLRYKYTDKPQLQNNGSLKISMPMGNIIEGMPVSYMYNALPNDVQFTQYDLQPASYSLPLTTYSIKDNEITFTVADYKTNETLIIDPLLEWATYYQDNNAALSVDEVFGLSDDGSNVWVTGFTTSGNFPVQTIGGGGFNQTAIGAGGGIQNVFILQFATTGSLIWATYYGGYTNCSGLSISSDGSNVWVTGQTYTSDFPVQTLAGGAYNQVTYGGSSDAFILDFTTAGVRKWATFYGGSNYDYASSINSDGTSVWITGLTQSANFPLWDPGGGAYYQSVIGSPYGTSFIVKFSTAGVQQWATYYGGGGGTATSDYGNSINSDGSNVWVTGQTNSTSFPTLSLTVAGSYTKATYAGGVSYGDVFILEFSTAGVQKWGTYYGGSKDEIGTSINSDGSNVWVTGYSQSANFPVKSLAVAGGYYQATRGSANGSAFILNFTTAGVRQWATYYGGNASDEGYSIMSDKTNVWVSGSVESSDFPTLQSATTCTGSYYQSWLNGGTQDVFILDFTTAGVRQWATYYGVDEEDEGSYVSSDGTNAFVAGDVESGAAYSYSLVQPGGAYYYSSHAATENAWIAQFITCPVVLPIQLLYFNCAPLSNGFELSWATASENNNRYFTVERSGDGVNFYPIDTIPGAGNSEFEKYYEYTDIHPLTGNNYYQLSQTDNFGTTVKDNVTSCYEYDSVLVYPNPASGVFAVRLPSKDVVYPTTISLYDLLGRQMLTRTVQNQQTIDISISALAASIYLVRVITEEKTYVIKLVIKK